MSSIRRVARIALTTLSVPLAVVIGLSVHTSNGNTEVSANLHASCEKVNIVGNCVPKTSEDGNTNTCVAINALGACINQDQLENPPHTMAR